MWLPNLSPSAQLMAEGKSATWVAYECGFADQSHLNRRFKEYYGVTPGTFQEQSGGDRAATARDSATPGFVNVEPSAA